MIPIKIREMRADDAPLIYDSWLRALAHQEGITERQQRSAFWKEYKPKIAAHIERGPVAVACSRADEGTILGWVCGRHYPVNRRDTLDASVLYFVFVKKDFRQAQIAMRLCASLGFTRETDVAAPYRTFWGWPRLERIFKSLTYTPEFQEKEP